MSSGKGCAAAIMIRCEAAVSEPSIDRTSPNSTSTPTGCCPNSTLQRWPDRRC